MRRQSDIFIPFHILMLQTFLCFAKICRAQETPSRLGETESCVNSVTESERASRCMVIPNLGYLDPSWIGRCLQTVSPTVVRYIRSNKLILNSVLCGHINSGD
ncbi:hypothetical protein F4775DRAFT_115453 [Biscogniauxia sp. FL1348]|nr:hypothetical protein F4775DRAFT_115453 [Biscogniauxia sp. FL1348]